MTTPRETVVTFSAVDDTQLVVPKSSSEAAASTVLAALAPGLATKLAENSFCEACCAGSPSTPSTF